MGYLDINIAGNTKSAGLLFLPVSYTHLLCGIVGIFLNLILFAGKLFAGMFSGAISITADAFNNLSDAGSSIITIAGFKMAAQRADEEHPYGHARREYVACLLYTSRCV